MVNIARSFRTASAGVAIHSAPSGIFTDKSELIMFHDAILLRLTRIFHRPVRTAPP